MEVVMKQFFVSAFVTFLLLAPAIGSAQTIPASVPSAGPVVEQGTAMPLMSAVRSQPVRLSPQQTQDPAAARPETREGRNWISRYPVLFGMLAGAGGGLIAAGTMENEMFCSTGSDEDCLFYNNSRFAVGAGMGAGIGALTGWIAGKMR